jgi:transcription elongation GreA/GreB family factor
MSRAFVKEANGYEADTPTPELRVSEHRNFVTANGLRLIEAQVRRIESALAEARRDDDEAAIARLMRDLRYWGSRRSSAEVVAPPQDDSVIRFGTFVSLHRADGSDVPFQIVGEDEAAPANGRISYVSPLARSLLGRQPGDTIRFGALDAEIRAIRTAP